MRGRAEEAAPVTRLWEPLRLADERPDERQLHAQPEHRVADGSEHSATFRDETTEEDRLLGDRTHVRLPLSFVGVEHVGTQRSRYDGGELPTQVAHVPDTRGQTLADPRRHHVRGIPDEEDASHPPTCR